VLHFLREVERRTGTKEGCAERDCGACTVVLVGFDGDALRCRAVNACILFIPRLDGKQLNTVAARLLTMQAGCAPKRSRAPSNTAS
jgi:xanthine dehydrogenase small subunit